MNSVKFLGRTTSDIELKRTDSGKSVATFSLAVKRPFTKDTTDFFNVVAWEKTAETLSNYVNKGTMIVIEGYITNRQYEKDGQKRYATEIVVERFHFCGKNEGQGGNSSQIEPQATETAFNNGFDYMAMADDDSELPF
jgi:single-strand DNA-binding protein